MKNTKKILCKFGVATMIFGTFFQGLCATTEEFFTAEQIADPAWATAIQRTMEVKAMTDEQDPVYNTVDRQFDACSYNIYAIERDLKALFEHFGGNERLDYLHELNASKVGNEFMLYEAMPDGPEKVALEADLTEEFELSMLRDFFKYHIAITVECYVSRPCALDKKVFAGIRQGWKECSPWGKFYRRVHKERPWKEQFFMALGCDMLFFDREYKRTKGMPYKYVGSGLL